MKLIATGSVDLNVWRMQKPMNLVTGDNKFVKIRLSVLQ
jgi:hypothetical protein